MSVVTDNINEGLKQFKVTCRITKIQPSLECLVVLDVIVGDLAFHSMGTSAAQYIKESGLPTPRGTHDCKCLSRHDPPCNSVQNFLLRAWLPLYLQRVHGAPRCFWLNRHRVSKIHKLCKRPQNYISFDNNPYVLFSPQKTVCKIRWSNIDNYRVPSVPSHSKLYDCNRLHYPQNDVELVNP